MTCTKRIKLDLACGKNKKKGFIGVDVWEGADLVCDLESFPWPFENDSVDEVFCSHYIEHVPNLVSFANELHRIMRPGARATIVAPYYSSIRAWQDPTHLRAISENTFLYFNKQWRLVNRLDHYPITADFDFEYQLILSSDWQDKPEAELDFAIKHYINVVYDIKVFLKKRASEQAEWELMSEKAAKYWQRGQRAKAAKIAEQLIAAGYASVQSYILAAEYYLMKRNNEQAERYFSEAVKMDSSALEAHCGLVRAMRQSGRHDKARAHLVTLENDCPDLASVVAQFLETA